ncbi:DUF4190 domain-containing protein [Arthrobacter bambusae]|uniref:DUF4190 domain-containing protein n=1 Tax=Arthrobacter bambusae TaxID=1338426 RepID=A0AAW8DDL5_9MICC|nr:DUF4190 domain-containing protein [Arthrobacter bambusae]MDP9903264.1 hypothetical protein [Arthrobacter bambusae]MDQ0128742.1 hypothetical protein [Arthrobacter bambusae]MDQ0180083.1 hypothetical protein [Arthrobacter bambusae]
MSTPEIHPVPDAGAPAQPQWQAPAYPAPYGAAPGPTHPYAAQPRTNVLAIISLISAFVFSAAAVVTGHIALSQIKRTGEAGRGMALAGLIIGYVGVAFIIVFFIIYIAVFSSIMAHIPNTGTSYRN